MKRAINKLSFVHNRSSNAKRCLPPASCPCVLPPDSRCLPSAFCLLLSAACFLLFTGCLNASAATLHWNRQSSGTLGWLHSVFFLDQRSGWAVGSKGVLLATVDGGITWKLKTKPTEDSLQDIYFSDERNGWLVCEVNIYELKKNEQPRTYLLHTRDGGSTWERVNVNGGDNPVDSRRDSRADSRGDIDTRLVRVIFSRGGRGWVFGEAGTVYTTRDLGETWNRLQLPTSYLLLGGAFVDNDRGWLVGAGATIVQTADGGDTWHVSKLIDARGVRFTATSFVDNRIGWAVGAAGKIYRTNNGGRTWEPQESGVAIDLLDVKFLNDLEGWAVGTEGTAIHTADGGLHWTSEPTGTTHPLERIFFADRDHGWAVGFGGTIIAYVRDGEIPRLRQ